MDANTLKTNLKADLMIIFTACSSGDMSIEDYADKVAQAIASRVAEYVEVKVKEAL